MTGKRANSGRGRAPHAGRAPAKKKRGVVEPTGRGQRLRESREAVDLTRKVVATELGWSESRLISYETEATQPDASELEQLAGLYNRDRAWLAFGDAYDRFSGARAASALWLPNLDGGELPVPSSLIAGVRGPLLCVVLSERTGVGLSSGDILVVQSQAVPAVEALWVVRGAVGAPRVGRVTAIGAESVALRFDIVGTPVSVPMTKLVGRVVATMQRAHVDDDSVPGARPSGTRGKR